MMTTFPRTDIGLLLSAANTGISFPIGLLTCFGPPRLAPRQPLFVLRFPSGRTFPAGQSYAIGSRGRPAHSVRAAGHDRPAIQAGESKGADDGAELLGWPS